jgi:hypothetical protein
MCTVPLPPGGYPIAVKYIIKFTLAELKVIKQYFNILYLIENIPRLCYKDQTVICFLGK